MSSESSYPSQGIPHNNYAAGSPILSAQISWGWSFAPKASIDNGSVVFRENATTIYPQTKAFSGGFDVFTVAMNDARETEGLGLVCNGTPNGSNASSYEYSANGILYGEVLLYSDRLSAGQLDYTEAYLLKKWQGKDTAGFRGYATAGAVRVGEGSSLVVTGGGTVRAASLGGAGSLTADAVDLAGDDIVAVAKADGTFGTLTVNGVLTLAETGTVTIDASAAGKLAPGTYTVLSAIELVCEGESFAWTCVNVPRNRTCSVFRDGNQIKLTVSANGLVIIFR